MKLLPKWHSNRSALVRRLFRRPWVFSITITISAAAIVCATVLAFSFPQAKPSYTAKATHPPAPSTKAKPGNAQPAQSETRTVVPTNTEQPSSAKPATTPSTSAPAQVAFGTPHVTYKYRTSRIDEFSSACNFQTDITVSADTWRGYSTGKIVVNVNYHSYYGEYPYTIAYTLSPGETKVFIQNLSIPTHTNGDSITTNVRVTSAGSGLGEIMMITDSTPAEDTSVGLNCF